MTTVVVRVNFSINWNLKPTHHKWQFHVIYQK